MTMAMEDAISSLEMRISDMERRIVEMETLIGEFNQIQFTVLHAEPDRYREGMIVYADGSDWNPGSGGGLYEYRGGAWAKL